MLNGKYKFNAHGDSVNEISVQVNEKLRDLLGPGTVVIEKFVVRDSVMPGHKYWAKVIVSWERA